MCPNPDPNPDPNPQLTKDMVRVTRGMDSVLQTMNPEKITMVMDKVASSH